MSLSSMQSTFLTEYFQKHEFPTPHQFRKISMLLSIYERTMYIEFIKTKTLKRQGNYYLPCNLLD